MRNSYTSNVNLKESEKLSKENYPLTVLQIMKKIRCPCNARLSPGTKFVKRNIVQKFMF